MTRKKRRLTTATMLKNKIRGASSTLKNRTPAQDLLNHVEAQRHALRSMKHAIGEARTSFRGSSLQDFEKWVANQYALSHQDSGIGVPKELLGVLPNILRPRTLEGELENTLITIKRITQNLAPFLALLDTLCADIHSRRFNEALSLLDSHIDAFGYSYWAIETKIALLSALGKSSTAREIISQLSAGPAGLNSFYFYHIGLRNEASQSTSRFKTLVARRLNDSKLSKEYITYASYRVAREIPTDSAALASILAYEGFSTKIDLLLTSTRIAYEILNNQEKYSEIEIHLCRNLLSTFRDSPFLLNGESDGTLLSAWLKCEIKAAIGLALHTTDELIDPGYSIRKGVSAIVSLSGSEADEENHRKYLQNFWWTPESMLMDSAGRIPRLVEIYADTWSPVDKQSHPFTRACVDSFNDLAHQISFGTLGDWSLQEGSSPPWYGQPNLADAVADCISVRASWEAYRNYEYQKALRLSQFSLFHNPRLLEVLPLEAMFKGVNFNEIRNYGISIDVCNGLHWYSQQTSERQVRTFKRFAIEEWIEGEGHTTIVDATKALIAGDTFPTVIEFFLYGACDLSTIELLLEVESTKDAKEIRATLLKLCAESAHLSAEHFIEEADELLEQLVVDEVLEEIDETMVSVDEEALLPAATREVAADFERYKKLIEGEESTRSLLDALMKSLRQQSATTFQIPESESADLLLQIIQTVLDRFIDDPVYGLDSIIGRRIRHGTISSELRGTLEQRSLIGQRPRNGADYDVPSDVEKYLQQFDANTRRGVTRAFSRFSASIDNLVAQLRDEVFQCRQKGRLDAVFELPISTPMFALAADSASEAPTAEVFCYALFRTFWFLLSVRVERDRQGVKELIERSLHEAFGKLSVELKASKLNGFELLASVQQASEELQLKANSIANWVRIPRVNNEDRTFQLALVFDAAMALCKSRRASFDPTSRQNIDPTISLNAHEYRIVFDALCIAIENIAEHSGVRSGNQIHTCVTRSDDKARLCFSIVSDIGKGTWNTERQSRVDSIRDEISRESFADRARRTKGSGLAKIATIVRKQENCKMEFHPIENNQKFSLYFELNHMLRPQTINSDGLSEKVV